MNLDFSTLCLLSVPGFLLGLMTGRLLSRARWHSLKKNLGFAGKFLGTLALVAYLVVSAVILGIMIIYMVNLPATAKPSNFWYTLFFTFWIVLNLTLEFRDVIRHRKES